MRTPITSHHFTTGDNIPDGGQTYGNGFAISWQRGPLGRGDERVDSNGAFVESVIAAAHDRLGFYQKSKFACQENERAMDCLQQALDILQSRTERREQQGVEGTHSRG